MSNGIVTIIGLNRIGTSAAYMLTKLEVEALHLVDNGYVKDPLNEGMLYWFTDTGKRKVSALYEKLSRINPNIDIALYETEVNERSISILSRISDCIIFTEQDLNTLLLVHKYSIKEKKPLIYAWTLGSTGFIYILVNRATRLIDNIIDRRRHSKKIEGIFENVVPDIVGLLVAYQAIRCIQRRPDENSILIFDITRESIAREKWNQTKKYHNGTMIA
ncbi:MAG: hypothetical protein DRJ64_03345 [Thermoprotei archaeon]|nr:MAG: hypothetical protein DRJ64_03345 [Thermoprotei archaeon]